MARRPTTNLKLMQIEYGTEESEFMNTNAHEYINPRNIKHLAASIGSALLLIASILVGAPAVRAESVFEPMIVIEQPGVAPVILDVSSTPKSYDTPEFNFSWNLSVDTNSSDGNASIAGSITLNNLTDSTMGSSISVLAPISNQLLNSSRLSNVGLVLISNQGGGYATSYNGLPVYSIVYDGSVSADLKDSVFFAPFNMGSTGAGSMQSVQILQPTTVPSVVSSIGVRNSFNITTGEKLTVSFNLKLTGTPVIQTVPEEPIGDPIDTDSSLPATDENGESEPGAPEATPTPAPSPTPTPVIEVPVDNGEVKPGQDTPAADPESGVDQTSDPEITKGEFSISVLPKVKKNVSIKKKSSKIASAGRIIISASQPGKLTLGASYRKKSCQSLMTLDIPSGTTELSFKRAKSTLLSKGGKLKFFLDGGDEIVAASVARLSRDQRPGLKTVRKGASLCRAIKIK